MSQLATERMVPETLARAEPEVVKCSSGKCKTAGCRRPMEEGSDEAKLDGSLPAAAPLFAIGDGGGPDVAEADGVAVVLEVEGAFAGFDAELEVILHEDVVVFDGDLRLAL